MGTEKEKSGGRNGNCRQLCCLRLHFVGILLDFSNYTFVNKYNTKSAFTGNRAVGSTDPALDIVIQRMKWETWMSTGTKVS